MLLFLGTTAASDIAHSRALRKADFDSPQPQSFLSFPQVQACVYSALILFTNIPVKLRIAVILIFFICPIKTHNRYLAEDFMGSLWHKPNGIRNVKNILKTKSAFPHLVALGYDSALTLRDI